LPTPYLLAPPESTSQVLQTRKSLRPILEETTTNLKFDYIWGMITGNDILEKFRELKPILRKEYSVKEIGLFGSFSDNTFSEHSDIDILIELERPIGWKFFTLEMFLESTFGRKIDLVTKNALKEQLRDRILNQVKYV